ncbi:WhiB family transcription factor [Mycobacterium phage Keshu]|uniref:WhiB family transcription factor n=4 Tax=Keshuvirus TaxID=2948781 RepID=G1D561_9CAUD|nr:WhiB transcriptional factor [Mycobacterium phage Keshu]YP_009202685.1 WhiB transcriptional factor [Mycobacterium phage ShedlockHolmes]YP_009637390.1 WhiB transcriptional factor [Mycobacterium phage Pixie]AOT23791.1 WhiB family transcription factor [Mycobacterium phage TBond007]AEK09864.1 WhiB family transcription factor [Mycobacterium phage Pixie]AJD82275.1 WhiB family transcription factor [Mycobacterium phage Keshu]AKF15231.1 WhiB family transcription factor [Mycobacterium phage ShedlockH
MSDVVDEYMQIPEHWEADALCQQVDPELFFPERGQGGNEAKRICARCPVIEECREKALSFGTELWGVWGGLTQRDRRLIIRSERKANAA